MEKITITHFRNPHRFWFKREDFFLDDEIADFRAELSKAARRAKVSDSWTPAVGELVAFFQKHAAVWDRAVVESITPDGDITLWIEDMGFPKKAKRKEIRPMPPNVKLPEKKIVREGGVFELVPAKKKFNLQTFTVDKVDCGGVWSQDAIDLMQEAIDVAESISFEVKSEPQRHVCFGNMTFHMPNGKRLPAQLLLADYSQKSEQFLEFISRDLCSNLRQKSNEASSVVSPVVTEKDFVNGWVEKVVDIQNDMFDESVSTYHPPEAPKTTRAVAKSSEREGLEVEEDEFCIPPGRQANGSGQRVKMSSDVPSIARQHDVRNYYGAISNRAKELFMQQNEEPVEQKQTSYRSQLKPQPAGINHSKDVPHIKKGQRGRNTKNVKSLESNVKHLGEGVVGKTAKKRYQRVLVHGPLEVTMVERIREAFFRPEVHEKLKDYRIGDVHRIQSHAWPHIFRSGSIILIGRRMSGKTLAYLPMLYTLMMNEKEKGEDDLPVGARAIVICASGKKVLQTSAAFDKYHDRGKMRLSVLTSCSPRDTKNHVIELQNGYDALFTTTPALQRLMQGAAQETVDLLTLEDVRYVVVDDYDAISANFKTELRELLKILLSRVDENGLCRAQVIFTSCQWMQDFREYWKKFDNPMLCIASGVESAMYAESKFNLQIMSREEKVLAIREILATETYFSEPTMIVCNTGEEVDYLMEILLKVSVSVMAYKEPSQQQLQIKDKAVILCTDACLMDVNVRNIQTLIHFSLPEKWSYFDNRFVVCFDYYEDQLVCENPNNSGASIHIFLDQDNDRQLPKIIHFMKTRFSKVDISPEILQCTEATLRRREEAKIIEHVALCPDMMEFGKCVIHEIDCGYRHIFSNADAASDLLPRKGFLRMKILSVVTPLHFKCHLLNSMDSHLDPYDKWRNVNQSDRFSVFQNDLNRHMLVEGNRITPASADVKENEIYVYQHEHNFLRVCVECVKREKSSVFVSISGVDSAKEVHKHPAQDLLVLPEEFRNFPHQLIDVRLFGLMPNDSEFQWDKKSTHMVESWVKPFETSDYVSFLGQIELTLRNTVYVKSLSCVEYFDSNETNFSKFCLDSLIKKNKLAVKNDEMKFIKHLAEHFGIYKEEEEEVKEEKVQKIEEKVVKVKEKWSSLAHESIVNVQIINFDSPREFYVQDLTSIEELRELNMRIRDFVEKETPKPCATLKVGDYCLVPLNDDYYRGKVWQETPDEERFHVFLVDEGINDIYHTSMIFEISQSLIEETPFFAIRCSLLGVKERVPKPTEEELDEIYGTLLQGPNDETILHVYAMDERTLRSGEMWKITNYAVILLVEDPEEHIVVNKRFVEEKFCEKDEKKWLLVEKFISDMKKLPKILSEKVDEEDVPDWDKAIPSSALSKFPKKKESVTKKDQSLDSDDTVSPRASSNDLGPNLIIFHPPPPIEWRQTNREIILKVSTVDMKDYRLVLKPTYLTLCLVFDHKPNQECLINLFGCIDPGKSSVKVGGNSLSIRLRKQVTGKEFFWTYLNDPPEKLSWLKKAIEVTSSDSEGSDDGVQQEKLGHFAEEEDVEDVESHAEDPDSDNELCFGSHFVSSD